jgi:hypothetical protein
LARPSGSGRYSTMLRPVGAKRSRKASRTVALCRDSFLQRPLPSAVLGIRLLVPSGELDNQTDAAVEGDGGVPLLVHRGRRCGAAIVVPVGRVRGIRVSTGPGAAHGVSRRINCVAGNHPDVHSHDDQCGRLPPLRVWPPPLP